MVSTQYGPYKVKFNFPGSDDGGTSKQDQVVIFQYLARALYTLPQPLTYAEFGTGTGKIYFSFTYISFFICLFFYIWPILYVSFFIFINI